MANAKTHSTGEPHPAPRSSTSVVAHEGSDPKLRPILHFAWILTVVSLVTFALMRWMFFTEIDVGRENDPPLPPLAAERQVPPEPLLQSMPGVPLVGGTLPEGLQPFSSTSFSDFEKKQNEALTSYGWVDRQAGIVHIPIERAIELTLKKGLPSAAPKSEKR